MKADSPRTSPRTRTFIFIALCSFIFALYVSEGILALLDPHRRLPFNGRKEGVLYTWGHEVKNNKLNFRERDFVVPKPAHVWRVMVLGDSLTWGAGLAVSERYSNLLEAMLQKRFPDKTIEILNFGVSGGPTVVENKIANTFVDSVQSDLIVVGFCLNDTQPRSQDYSVEREQFKSSAFFYLFSLVTDSLKNVYLANIADRLTTSVFTVAEKLGFIPSWQVGLDRTYDPNSREWKAFEGSLKNIKFIADSKGLPPPVFAVLNQAWGVGTADGYKKFPENISLRWYSLAAQAAKGEGFTVIDFVDEILALPPDTSLVLNELDAHPSTTLNKVYAEKLFQVLEPLVK